MSEQGEIRCPKCGSGQITTHKRGLSLKNAAIGAGIGFLTAGVGIGAAAGALVGINNVMCTCIACGHQWKAGTVAPAAVVEKEAPPTALEDKRSSPEVDPAIQRLRNAVIELEVRKGLSLAEAEAMAKELYR